ncbi:MULTISPECIES: MarR family winged helix-turn-helix transcriptional regulator [unclassified Mesorhizobium]|uniref:MarR family winged helix-turn-helix transcriptional regulator n=1 Tax=unclassified Mesorhizobium TaxID=325217 RepID=UPI000FD5BCAA|nr:MULTISPECIES: MarR family winged helix-turn-helix transcriptional regulator [unclassified Mesorhizobium]RVD50536.1 MarR family transcriptional regulator [Mesorhizobium sp. M8A.F.Ca.ET.023.02.2.1]TGP98864.1 MarR family transcriptional regulator [Mesorhizobium sp. M8A.F.Ca.ET.218.01.1.1]TGU88096.1 MarR family transcriptional regulator [Mesorhizobium sp. M00.F.Ca.ET.151.01.1.1]TGV09166.1 MarR family transcriptional regulator [Mesorhizobium sp. M8A.F.Ca.ET.173.01.1.1]RWC67533.1 MAG: MarR family
MADGQDLNTRFSGPSESPGLLLWRTTMRWQRVMTAALAPLDLTHVQFVLLASAMWLGRDGEPPNQVQLAAQAGTEVKMTSDVVARLEAKGLIAREADPRDSRAKVIRVTSAGAAAAQRAIVAVEAADAAFFEPVDEARLVGLLRQLAGEIR